MSVEKAKIFLEEVTKDVKLVELLKGVSLAELEEAIAELDLEKVNGGVYWG